MQSPSTANIAPPRTKNDGEWRSTCKGPGGHWCSTQSARALRAKTLRTQAIRARLRTRSDTRGRRDENAASPDGPSSGVGAKAATKRGIFEVGTATAEAQ